MSKRNFSMQKYWMEKAKNWKPLLSFSGTSEKDWKAWYGQAYSKLIELLGEFPQKVELNAVVEYSVEDDDLIRERVVFDSEEFMSVPCQVLYPKNMKKNKSNPAILCCHGHGTFGKDAVAGVRSSSEHEKRINEYNYDYGKQLAKAGFLTICPDLRAFGERLDKYDLFPGRDSCDVQYLRGAILGVYTLTLNIWDMIRCIDYLESRNEVDPGRIGMMGLSLGGTITTFTAAIEKRIKAADIIAYISPWSKFGIESAKICGSQIVPEIYKYFDTDEIAGLIAPRPLLLEMGIYDNCFQIQNLIEGYNGVSEIYNAADAADKLWKDIFPGPHAFAGNKVFEFFKTFL